MPGSSFKCHVTMQHTGLRGPFQAQQVPALSSGEHSCFTLWTIEWSHDVKVNSYLKKSYPCSGYLISNTRQVMNKSFALLPSFSTSNTLLLSLFCVFSTSKKSIASTSTLGVILTDSSVLKTFWHHPAVTRFIITH